MGEKCISRTALTYSVLTLIFSVTIICSSHVHDHERPSFKYSREANENFKFHSKYAQKHSNHHQEEHMHIQDGAYLKSDHVYDANMGDVWLYSVGSTIFISAIPFLLLFIIPIDSSIEMRPRLKVLLAFASGGLLGDAFLHLIPHSINPHNTPGHSHSNVDSHGHFHDNEHTHSHIHSKNIIIGLWVLGGIVVFLTVEKLVRFVKGDKNSSHGHSHDFIRKKSPDAAKGEVKKTSKSNNYVDEKLKSKENVAISGYLNLAADFAHNFTDGLAIGASFLAGKSVGFVTTITILLHEVPHEIGDFAILIKSGCSRQKAMVLQLITALGALSGNALSLIGVGTKADAAPWVLPFTAGGFIYIATVSVLPELLEESTKLVQSIKEIAALLAGVILMIFIAYLE